MINLNNFSHFIVGAWLKLSKWGRWCVGGTWAFLKTWLSLCGCKL